MNNHQNNHNEFDLIAQPAKTVEGRVQVPGDKSISHRSIMLGAIATGVTRVRNFLQGDDSLATLQAFQQMGVKIEENNKEIVIHGVGKHGLSQPEQPLWLGNSGTAMRLMTGLLSAQPFASTLIGDESLSSRPMTRVTKPLHTMGATINATGSGHAPLHIEPVSQLQGIEYTLPIASAQIKSSVLFAGLYADSVTTIHEPSITRNHTELMMQAFGVDIKTNDAIVLNPANSLIGQDITIPGDISSSAFFLVAATLAAQGDMVIEQVGINPTRAGVIDILQLMGADLRIDNRRECGCEGVADIRIRPAQLHGIDIPERLVSLAIDEFPVLFIAAACAKGTTRLTGAAELRVKESDRISAMVEGLQRLGIKSKALDDGAVIEGGTMTGGTVNSYHDHRIAMAFAIASLVASDPIHIRQCRNIQTSFPDFIDLANRVGLSLKKIY